MTNREAKARWLQARQNVLNSLEPLEKGCLLYRDGELSEGATHKHVYKLKKRLAEIDAAVPQEWVVNLSPALAARLSGSHWDIAGIVELIEQYEAAN